MTSGHVRLAASGLGVDERTVWRWISQDGPGARAARPGKQPYQLSETDREAFAYYRGNISAVHRARTAAVAGDGLAAGVPVPDFLRRGWAQARPLALRTMQEAFARELRPAERAAWRDGEQGRRAAPDRRLGPLRA
ncbi:hypothetical protein ACWDRB_47400 [Nonomuraea sp. NPDC003707]